jgi:putative peptidoglycan lipid II flippase
MVNKNNTVKRLISKANSRISVSTAAILLASTTLISSLLGLLRERLLLTNFGISAEVDAYKAAFTVPDFMFFLLVSGALSVTFIPVFTERLTTGNRQSAWQLSSSVLNLFAIVTSITSVVIIIFAPWLVRYVVAPGLDESTRELATTMMRVIALNPFLFAISSVLTSMQQAVGRFFFYALAPSLYNVGIIIGIIYIAPSVGIIGVAYGVLVGSVLQLITSIIGLVGMGYNYESQIRWQSPSFKKVLSLLPSRSLDQGVDYVNIMVETNIASRLKEGAITAYQTAFTLHMVPINLIGVAISTAVFPQLSQRIAMNRSDLFKKDFTSVMRMIIWLVLPTSVIAYFGRGYLVRLLVADGNPTISALLGFLVVAIAFRSVFHLFTRSYYAQQDTKTPLYISLFAIGLNIVLAVYLAKEERMGIYGLALAQSIATAFEAVVLIIVLVRRMSGIVTIDLLHGLIRMLSASGLMAFITYVMVAYILPLQASDSGFFSLVPKFGLIVTISLLFYVLVSFLFGIKESYPLVTKTKNMLFRPIKLQ